ncbi:hypothetical protein NQT66_13220 [Cellulophaga baltica]|uniref:hypothetical protein n=1 Tax=Cellulophaga baltica TaxID=76594 RepID=UPI0021473F54|nr:hypothetical protein [Cellulophaga baltica]MCR1025777.1 hypothetical protein [Cellulophaga baltica]
MLNDTGSVASIIGTMIAIGTILYAIVIDNKLTSFSKRVLFNTRVTPLKKDFDKNISELNKLFIDYQNQKEMILTELNFILANIRGITPKLPDEIVKEFKDLDNKISNIINGKLVDKIDYGDKNMLQKYFIQNQYDLDSLWSIYGDLSYFSKVLDNLIKDKKIS